MTQHDRDSFQVDLGGVVDLLSRHIYSGPRVYLRELLQNAVDACAARSEEESDYQPSIRISPLSGERTSFSLVDNGTGLTASEAKELLATVGRTSKRDEFGFQRAGRLGQFGIGLLSSFMVADEITMVSRSSKPGAAIRWIGRADGTFSLEELDETATDVLPIGTTVHLIPRADERGLLTEDAVIRITSEYGRYLPVPIQVNGEKNTTITVEPVFKDGVDPGVRMRAGHARLGRMPFDAIDLKGPGVEGVAYVLPEAQAPHMARQHSIYVNRMLVSHGPTTLLPNWAFFVECEINSTELNPTASREAVMDDSAFAATRDHIGACIKKWLLDLAMTKPHRIREFTGIHDLALRELCLSDPELAEVMLGLLTLETSRGRISIGEIATLSITEDVELKLAASLDDFRQLVAISRSDVLVINGGYIHDANLARLIPTHFPPLRVTAADLGESLDLMELPPLADLDNARTLETHVSSALEEVGVKGISRVFDPTDMPAVVIIDSQATASRDRNDVRGSTTEQWADILSTVDSAFSAMGPNNQQDKGLSVLCLNWNNALVRQLASISDSAVISRTTRLLYVQALLAGRRPLGSKERAMLNGSLSDLVSLSLSTEI